MSPSPKPTRAYKRISPADGARAVALWEAGAATIEEIAAEIGNSPRAVQMHLKKTGATKGSTAFAMASKLTEKIVADEYGDEETRIEKGKASRAATYSLSDQIERCVGVILGQIADDPSTAFRFSAPLKALDLAAAAVERTSKLKISALGLDRIDSLDPLPIIEIRDLGEAEIQAMRARQRGEEGEIGGDDC